MTIYAKTRNKTIPKFFRFEKESRIALHCTCENQCRKRPLPSAFFSYASLSLTQCLVLCFIPLSVRSFGVYKMFLRRSWRLMKWMPSSWNSHAIALFMCDRACLQWICPFRNRYESLLWAFVALGTFGSHGFQRHILKNFLWLRPSDSIWATCDTPVWVWFFLSNNVPIRPDLPRFLFFFYFKRRTSSENVSSYQQGVPS